MASNGSWLLLVVLMAILALNGHPGFECPLVLLTVLNGGSADSSIR